MIALVLRNDPLDATAATLALMDMGYQVVCVDNIDAAEGIARGAPIDLVLCDEMLGGTLTHGLLLSIARRHAQASAFVLTGKTGVAADELFLLIPSVYALLPQDASINLLVHIVRSGLGYTAPAAKEQAEAAMPVPSLDLAAEVAALEDAIAPVSQPDAVAGPSFLSIRTPVFH